MGTLMTRPAEPPPQKPLPRRCRSRRPQGEKPMPPVIDPQKCTGCGTCADICNSGLFTFDRKKDATPQVTFPDECWHCDSCVLDCPAGAIRLRLPICYSLMYVEADTLHPKTKENC